MRWLEIFYESLKCVRERPRVTLNNMGGHEGPPLHVEPQTTDAKDGDPVYQGGAFYVEPEVKPDVPFTGEFNGVQFVEGHSVDPNAPEEKEDWE